MAPLRHPLSKDSETHKAAGKSENIWGYRQHMEQHTLFACRWPWDMEQPVFDELGTTAGSSLREKVDKGSVLSLKANAREEYTNIMGKYIPWHGTHLVI